MSFTDRHLLGIEPLRPEAITEILDLADTYVKFNRQSNKRSNALAGLTQINMFFENSTRTQASFMLEGALKARKQAQNVLKRVRARVGF